ncbi:MAG: flagellar motor protein MotB [Sphingomonadales bacterium]
MRQSTLASNWLLTFGDLLGILLALFILMYATSDQQSERLSRAVVSLAESMRQLTSGETGPVLAGLQGPYGYQITLLDRHISTVPRLRLSGPSPESLKITLKKAPLRNTLGDGLWLESLERFEVPITLTLATDSLESLGAALQDVAAFEANRKALGLEQPWRLEIGPVGSSDYAVISIDLSAEDEKDAGTAFEVGP